MTCAYILVQILGIRQKLHFVYQLRLVLTDYSDELRAPSRPKG